MIKKVCLAFPRFKHKSGDPPIGLCSLASYLRKYSAVEVDVLDTTFHPSFAYVEGYLRRRKPDLVGIYFSTPMYWDGKAIASMAKSLGAYVVAGGPHATVAPESLIDDVDMVVIGEGEKTLLEVIQNYDNDDISGIKGICYKKNGSIEKTASRGFLEDLDSLAVPAFDLVDMKKYFDYWHYLDAFRPGLKGLNIMASRGCPFNCSFCQPTLRRLFGDTIRYKSPEYLVEEIEHYVRSYSIDNFFFHDDTFGVDKQWAYAFFDGLRRKDIKIRWGCNARITGTDREFLYAMYGAGLRCIHFGIESGSQRILDNVYCKGLKVAEVKEVIRTARRLGIYTGGFFMLGAPGETKGEIGKTTALAFSSRLTEASFSIVTPFPGTRLHDRMQADGRYTLSRNYADFNYYKKASYSSESISQSDLVYFQRRALFLFYLHPLRWKYILKHIISVKGIRTLLTKIKRFF